MVAGVGRVRQSSILVNVRNTVRVKRVNGRRVCFTSSSSEDWFRRETRGSKRASKAIRRMRVESFSSSLESHASRTICSDAPAPCEIVVAGVNAVSTKGRGDEACHKEARNQGSRAMLDCPEKGSG